MKSIKWIKRILLSFILLVILGSCLDELDIETFGEEQSAALVVEAVFTDEIITQKVYLSRSSTKLDLETDTVYSPFIPLGSRPIETVDMEGGATVKVLNDNGVEYLFTEGMEGVYYSNQPFALEMGVNYTLDIKTSNGLEYTSDPLSVQGKSKLTNVYAERATNDMGEEGVAIYADSEPLQGDTQYYRYTYEETYKIVAPYWSDEEFKLTDYDPCALPEPTYTLEVVPREIENQICYNTVSSNRIDQFNTVGAPDGNITRKLVRFITRDNFILAHRYSILLKQMVQSSDAYSFYEILKGLSSSEDVFSQVQPGSIYANVRRKDGSSENVLGYVEAVGVTEQRLFFNFEDFFPGEEDSRPYAFNCILASSPESHISYCASDQGGNPCPQSVIEQVHLDLIEYFDVFTEDYGLGSSCPGPYIFVPRICGDCTVLGDNVKPEFWVD